MSTLPSMRTIVYLLTGCILISGSLLYMGPTNEVEVFSSDTELESFLLRQIYDFGYPHERVRTRELRVNDTFSRQIITVDIDKNFPKTRFHKNLADSLSRYDINTYGIVQLTEPVTEIHLSLENTVIKTIRLVTTD